MAGTDEPTSQQVVIKWHGTEFSVQLADDDTVGSLKRKIEAETEVAPKRQKLLGLKAKKGGGLPADTVAVSELLLKPGMKVMMMGCAAVQHAPDHASNCSLVEPTLRRHAQTASWRGTDAARSCWVVRMAPMVQDTRGCHGGSGQDG